MPRVRNTLFYFYLPPSQVDLSANAEQSIVATPLWTTRPGRMAEFNYDPALALTPADVADSMLDIIQQGSYAGGTILEIAAGGKRVIPVWNIDPPAIPEGKNSGAGTREGIHSDYGRILEKLDKERGLGIDIKS